MVKPGSIIQILPEDFILMVLSPGTQHPEFFYWRCLLVAGDLFNSGFYNYDIVDEWYLLNDDENVTFKILVP